MPGPTHPPRKADFLRRYRAGELGAFFPLGPGETGAALELPRPSERATLCAALEAHARRLAAPAAVLENIATLALPRSRAVVTGQQTGLLLGPVYTLSKAVSALALARALSSEDRPVVPVFWLASQDHDTHEVDSAFLLDESERLARVSLPLPQGVPAGRIPMDPGWVAAIASQIGGMDFPEARCQEVLGILDEAAARARTYADWFAAILYRLLGAEGLVVLDPTDSDIAPLFAPVLASELRRPLASSSAINAAAAELARLGIDPQLGRGEDATNLFLEEREPGRGKPGLPRRYLLRSDTDGFRTEARSYTADELLAILEAEPGRITPAAGLRPVTQDAVLPTAATVVGPGELRYFAQLRGVYEHFDVAMPLIWPRTQVTVLEPPAARIMDKFGLNYQDLAQDFAGFRERAMLELSGHGDAFRAALQDLEDACAKLIREIRGIDPTLAGTVNRGEAHIRKTLDILERKSAAALAQQDSTYARQWRRLEAHLFPAGTPQERILSPFSFFLKFGVDPVLESFLELPPTGEHTVRI